MNTNQQFPAHRKKLIKPKSCKDIRRVCEKSNGVSGEQGEEYLCGGDEGMQRYRGLQRLKDRELDIEAEFKAITC